MLHCDVIGHFNIRSDVRGEALRAESTHATLRNTNLVGRPMAPPSHFKGLLFSIKFICPPSFQSFPLPAVGVLLFLAFNLYRFLSSIFCSVHSKTLRKKILYFILIQKMTVIWGLDLREMQWAKFKSSYMFNTEYHLRRSKMIVYQIAMILCVCSESVGTAALSEYVDQQEFVAGQDHLAVVYNDDFVGIMSYNIFVGVAVATIFGAAFFFDLFWPERHESPSVHLAWKICAVIMCVMGLADALAMTVIVATKSAYLSGPHAPQGMLLLQQN